MTSTRRKRWVFPAAAALLGLAVALAAAEGIGRATERRWLTQMLGWQVADLPVHRVSDDPDLLYELRPGAAWAAPDGREIHVNDLGFRDPPRSAAKQPGTQRVLCLGGSNTYGATVQDHETWPAALERELDRRVAAPVEVWNLGVSGWDTRQKVALARRATELYDPDVLIFQLYNAGPRLLLEGDAPTRRVRQDPSLLDAWNAGALDLAPTGPLARVSALARLGAWRTVRVERGHVMDGRLVAARRAWTEGTAELGRFLDEIDGDPLALGLIIPAGFQYFSECEEDEQVPQTPEGFAACDTHVQALDQLRGTGLLLLDLTAEPVPDLPAIRDSHPGPDVYTWYADRLADVLFREPTDTPPRPEPRP